MQNKSSENSQKKGLKEKLPPGYRGILKEKMDGKYSEDYIYKVVCGIRENFEILQEANALANRWQELKQSAFS